MGAGSGTREMGTGLGRGLSSSPQRPSPNHPTDSGREARRRSHKYVQNSEGKEVGLGLREGAGEGPGHPCQGALAPSVAVGALGGPLACGRACGSSGSVGRRPAPGCSPSLD